MSEKKRVLAFGEVMLRIAMANYQLLEQTKDARLNFTGTGLNVLSGISHFDHETSLLTQLPANRLGQAAKAEIRKLGISDQLLKQGGTHMGIYILEQGFGNRPAEVTYLDRLHSSFGISQWSSEEIDQALAGQDLVHICGISLILTDESRQAAFRLAERAKKLGKLVCFDFNYRPSLNTEHDQQWLKEQYQRILQSADIVIGSNRDLTELLALSAELGTEDAEQLAQAFLERYQLTYFVGTERSQRDNQRYLKGFIYSQEGLSYSKEYPVHVLDRVGTGDAYAAGIIVGALEDWPVSKLVEFATASSVLAHTTLGDSPLVSREQVERFMAHQDLDIIR